MADKSIEKTNPGEESINFPGTHIPKTITTEPTKKFFVQMLTRDISLEDAILDLLDNCVDGILRAEENGTITNRPAPYDDEKPYQGFYAHISFDGKHFQIEDNCGGIPADLIARALRLGRPDPSKTPNGSHVKDPKNGVGVYGIGMKRAIFKMGGDAILLTQNQDARYEVDISTEWLNSDGWDLSVELAKTPMKQDGTSIRIESLYEAIQEMFDADLFEVNLLKQISSHYSVILTKGFEVVVNKIAVKPKSVLFKFDEEDGDGAIRPYVFKTELDGVEVFMAVGFRSAIPTVEDIDDEQDHVQMTTRDAGWTIICNDRVVVSNEKSALTGWGTGNIPVYHVQYRAISGVVEFKGDADKLPTTTTKRGLDASSALYQRVLDRMREGVRLFITYTNDWKSREPKSQISSMPTLGFSELKAETQKPEYEKTLRPVGLRSGLEGMRFLPKLPTPPDESTAVRITYSRDRSDVEKLSGALFPDSDQSSKELRKKVGELTFDRIFAEVFEKGPTNGGAHESPALPPQNQ